MRKKTYAVSDEIFTEIVMSSNSIAEILRKLDLRSQHGPSHRVIKNRMASLNLTTDHFDRSKYRDIQRIKVARPLNEILVENSDYASSPNLRVRLIREGLLKPICAKCQNNGEWLGEKLQLQLDHINGIHTDNRIENLRILCPNCHSQTGTHSGKNRKVRRYYCPQCGKQITKHAKHCSKCAQRHISHLPHQQSKIVWPTREELERMIWDKSVQGTAKLLGVGGTSVIKKCKRLGISMPPVGYWAKRRQGGMTHEEALKPKEDKPKKPIKRFTLEQLFEIKTKLEQGISCQKIATEYGVHRSTISAIKRGESYKMAVPKVAATSSSP